MTELYAAVREGMCEIVKLLLENDKLDINAFSILY